mgnify:CR=1 FL=1
MKPRLVIVTRKTNLEALVEHHGTEGQARFWVECRKQSFDEVKRAHEQHVRGLTQILRQIPADRRRARLDRADVDRFLFAPDDVVMVVGQDGLVPNVAKYLRGQLVIGVNPDKARNDGVLCRHAPEAVAGILDLLETQPRVERRTMALAVREDGEQLLALNELFIGHKTHQSARYVIDTGAKTERQSSSGIICATGTGSTGWARSIMQQRNQPVKLPDPQDRTLAWMVREPFPSRITGTTLQHGLIEDTGFVVTSEMPNDGVVFADGMEWDAMELNAGRSVTITAAKEPLNLVI